MSRVLMKTAALAALLPAVVLSKAQAQVPAPASADQNIPTYVVTPQGLVPVSGDAGAPARFAPQEAPRPIQLAESADGNAGSKDASVTAGPAVVVPGHGHLPHYPYLDAPLYPAPQPFVPRQVGGVMIVNQALHPHEMLYPHKYRAVYPPYYYRIKGSWIWTPFGMRSHDRWDLVGTEVKVKYRGNYGLLSGFVPPLIR